MYSLLTAQKQDVQFLHLNIVRVNNKALTDMKTRYVKITVRFVCMESQQLHAKTHIKYTVYTLGKLSTSTGNGCTITKL